MQEHPKKLVGRVNQLLRVVCLGTIVFTFTQNGKDVTKKKIVCGRFNGKVAFVVACKQIIKPN